MAAERVACPGEPRRQSERGFRLGKWGLCSPEETLQYPKGSTGELEKDCSKGL